MKTLQVLSVAGIIALLGLLNVVTAEIRNDSALQSLTFAVEPGEDSVGLPDISFDNIGSGTGENAQSTCAMTPGGMESILLDEPLIQPPPPVPTLSPSPDVAFQPMSALNAPPPNTPMRTYPNPDPDPQIDPDPGPDPDLDPDPDPTPTPEPATLIIVGFGIAAASYAARRKQTPRR